MNALRIGTRESKLARLQTDMIVDALQPHLDGLQLEIVALSTTGDKVLNKPLTTFGGTGVFVKELEDALLKNEVDFVVHSLKDVPTSLPEGLCLAATLLRADARDVFLSRNKLRLCDLPAGSKVATSSRRRAAQLSAYRSDLEFVDVRGNVPTRLKKLEEGHCDAMILAAAGLERLGLQSHIVEYLDPDISVPAAGQGALALECRSNDEPVLKLLSKINDATVSAETRAERAFLSELGGGCSVPIGVLARANGNQLVVHACIADGTRLAKGTIYGELEQPEQLGVALVEQMLANGAGPILDAIMERPQQPISPP